MDRTYQPPSRRSPHHHVQAQRDTHSTTTQLPVTDSYLVLQTLNHRLPLLRRCGKRQLARVVLISHKLETDRQSVREILLDDVAPLDCRDALRHEIFEREIAKLRDTRKPVSVDVQERALVKRIKLRDRESRTRDFGFRSERGYQLLNKRRLATREWSLQHHRIARLQ